MGYVMGKWYDPQPDVAEPYLEKVEAESALGMERARGVSDDTPGRERGAAINFIRGRMNAIRRLTGLSAWRKWASQPQIEAASDCWNALDVELKRLQAMSGTKVRKGVGRV